MRIDRNIDIRLFHEFEVSKVYRQASINRKIDITANLVVGSPSLSSDIEGYCKAFGHSSKSEEEKLAYWITYNMGINNMLYLNFKVELVSTPFYEAAKSNVKKLLKSACESSIFELLGDCSGTMLFSDYIVQYAIMGESLFLMTDKRSGSPNTKLFYFYGQLNDIPKIDEMEELVQIGFVAIAILILKKYGEVETVMCGGNVRRKLPNSEDTIVNKAPFPITVLDSSWLRTIVRKEGFLVRGHFRLQPYGEKRLERKLIYIKPFQKHGYVRRAKKLVAAERALSYA